MTVTKKSGGPWQAKASAADIRHLEAVANLLAPLVETPGDWQQAAKDASIALTELLAILNKE